MPVLQLSSSEKRKLADISRGVNKNMLSPTSTYGHFFICVLFDDYDVIPLNNFVQKCSIIAYTIQLHFWIPKEKFNVIITPIIQESWKVMLWVEGSPAAVSLAINLKKLLTESTDTLWKPNDMLKVIIWVINNNFVARLHVLVDTINCWQASANPLHLLWPLIFKHLSDCMVGKQ